MKDEKETNILWLEQATENFEDALENADFETAETIMKDVASGGYSKATLKEFQGKLDAAKDAELFRLTEQDDSL